MLVSQDEALNDECELQNLKQRVKVLETEVREGQEFFDAAYEDAQYYRKKAEQLEKIVMVATKMRAAQKAYFKERRPSQLADSKKLEREFDTLMEEWARG